MWLSFIFYLGMGLVLWWPVLSGEERLFVRDLTVFAEPARQYLFERVLAGELPLWAPWQGGGAPFLADVAVQALYPPSYLGLLGRDAGHGLGFSIACHAIAAPFAAHGLLRALGIDLRVTIGCALLYALSGYAVSITENVTYMPAVVWLPLFGASFAHCGGRGRGWVVVAAVCLAMIILAGDIVGAVTAIGLGAAIGVSGGGTWVHEKRLLQTGVMLGFVSVAALGITSVQWLPALELTALSVRGEGVPLSEALIWTLPIARIVEIVQPFVFGSMYRAEFLSPELYPVREGPWAESIYLGWITVGLAIAALWRSPRVAWPYAALAGMMLVLALGDQTGLHSLIFSHIPALSSVRFPEKWLLGLTLAMCILAARGAHDLLDVRPLTGAARFAVPALAVAVLMATTLVTSNFLPEGAAAHVSRFWSARLPILVSQYGGLLCHAGVLMAGLLAVAVASGGWRRSSIPLILLLGVADLLWVHADLPPKIPARTLAEARISPVWATLEREAAPRVFFDARPGTPNRIATPDGVDLVFARTGVSPDNPFLRWARFVVRANGVAERNVGALGSTRYLNGDFSPLENLEHWRWLHDFAEFDPWGTFALANVSYVVTPVSPIATVFSGPRFREVAVYPQWNSRVLAVEGAIDRARIVPRSDAFAPRGERIPRSLFEAAPMGSVSILRTDPERWELEIEAVTEEAALLVTESFAKGWNANVNGVSVPTRPVAGRFLGVPVPLGKSVVTLVYREPSLALGAAVSAATLLGLILIFWWSGWSRGPQGGRRSEGAPR